MPIIRLETHINAPIVRVFDLARSIDLHKLSTRGTHEEAIAGRTSGLIELGETVTWRAKHFGVYQNLTVEITKFEKPHLFEDIMLSGTFKKMKHNHRFKEETSETIMIDEFEFISPLGPLGKIADSFFLKSYMKRFLVSKNKVLKKIAESEEWKNFIKNI